MGRSSGGGAVHIHPMGSLKAYDCEFRENRAQVGGAVFCQRCSHAHFFGHKKKLHLIRIFVTMIGLI